MKFCIKNKPLLERRFVIKKLGSVMGIPGEGGEVLAPSSPSSPLSPLSSLSPSPQTD